MNQTHLTFISRISLLKAYYPVLRISASIALLFGRFFGIFLTLSRLAYTTQTVRIGAGRGGGKKLERRADDVIKFASFKLSSM